uniref:Gamma-aminobutyric acid receptor-associated protein-like 2 n=1 Tax=Bos mutus grunniens TaxID=30521 RepID=A0A8B9YNX6_BOSMU
MKWMFKEDHSLEHRCVESAKIRAKYPDRVPVIVEKVSGSQIVDIDKRKYLVPSDITVAQFMWIIRKRIQLPSEKAIFLFVDKTVPQSSLTMGQLYEKEKDEDGFLWVREGAPTSARPGGGFVGPTAEQLSTGSLCQEGLVLSCQYNLSKGICQEVLSPTAVF